MKTRQWLGIATVVLAAAVTAQAQTYTWTGAGAGGRWNVADMWLDEDENTGIPVWSNTVDLVWNSPGAGTLASWIGNHQPLFRSITFNNNVVNPVTINLSNAPGATSTTARPITFDSSTGTASLTVASGATAPITFSGGDVAVASKTFVLDSDLLVTNNGTGLLTLPGGRMTGASNITYAGSGTTRISDDGGSTEHTGNTTINSGIVSVQLERNVNGILDITDMPIVTVKDGATLAVENGWTDVQIGNLLSRTGTVFQAGARLGFNTAANNRNYSVAITDTTEGKLGLVKIGANTLTLEGANTYTGGTFINEGVVSVNAVGRLGGNTVGNEITLNGGILQLTAADHNFVTGNRGVVVGAKGGTIQVDDVDSRVQITTDAQFGGSGTLTVTGAGRVVLGAITNNTFTGNFVATDGGRLHTNTPEHLGPGTITLDNGTFMCNTTTANPATFTNSMTVAAGGGTFDTPNNGRQFAWNGDISGAGAVTVGNTHTLLLTLGGANTYAGNTTVSAGSTLTLAEGGSQTFTIGSDGVNNQIAGAGTVNLNGKFVFDLTGADTIAGSGWRIVDHTTLTPTYGATFLIDGFVDEGGGVWTKDIDGDTWYQFDESTGLLITTSGESLVEILSVEQQAGTKNVLVTYKSVSVVTNQVTISLTVTNSASAEVSATTLSGDVGADVETGMSRSITWNAGADWNENIDDLSFTVTMDDGDTVISDTQAAVSVDTQDYTLVVASAYGSPTPPVGTNTYAWGTTLTASVQWRDGDFICTGWTNGSGSIPADGTTTSTGSISLTDLESSITWTWTDEFVGSIWDGGADDGTAENARWNTDGNWVGDVQPAYGNTTDIQFHTDGAGNLTSYLGANAEIRSLWFNDNVVDALTIVTENHLAATRTLTFSAASDNALLVVDSDASADITISGGGSIPLNSGLDVEHNGSGLLTFGSVISGNNSITLSGDGSVQMTQINTYSGGTFINNGIVIATTEARNLGLNDTGNPITLNGGTLRFDAGTGEGNFIVSTRGVVVGANGGTLDVTTAGERISINNTGLSGSGQLTVRGAGYVPLTADNSAFSGNWLLDGGTIWAPSTSSAAYTLGTGSNVDLINGGRLVFSNTDTRSHSHDTVLGTGGGSFVLGQTGNANPTITWSGNISGSGALTVDNSGGTNGVLTLSGVNVYTGNTTVHAGSTLTLADGGSQTFTIGANGVNNQITGAGTVNLNGTIVFDLDGAGTLPGDSWTIVQSETHATYGSTFSVGGFVDKGDGTWTLAIGDGSSWHEFDQSTGVLEVKGSVGPVVDPDIDSIGITLDNGDVVISIAFDDSGSDTYTLQFSTNLVTGIGWVDVVTGAAESPLVYTNDTTQGFFRIKAE